MNLLVAGLGGGLDVINASLLYFIAKQRSIPVMLGSTRPLSQGRLSNFTAFTDCGALISMNTTMKSQGRYIEPEVSRLLNENLVFFSRTTLISSNANATTYDRTSSIRPYKEEVDLKKLADAIAEAVDKFNFTHVIFVDGGGDSLILRSEDCNAGSETLDPFKGGDSELLEAVAEHLPEHVKQRIYQAVISVGLDISEDAFAFNTLQLQRRNAYLGKRNMATGEYVGLDGVDCNINTLDAQLIDTLLQHKQQEDSRALASYFELAQSVLVLTAEDAEASALNSTTLTMPKKLPSHTATVTYHALKGHFGVQRTYVDWEPVLQGNQRGTIVKPEHQWMHFFKAATVHELKKELNSQHNK